MKNYQLLIEDLICGLSDGKLSISDSEKLIMSADIDNLDKKGLITLLLENTFISI